MQDSSSSLIHRATCAVYIDGMIKGTAWLVTDEGHLLTAGHILGKNAAVEKVEVRFAEDIPLEAYKIQWEYQPLAGTDFAILKLTKAQSHRNPLPIAAVQEAHGTFRLCGFGITLQDRSEGNGSFVGVSDPQNFVGNRLFLLESTQLGEAGYSGAAVFSNELQAVVAIQVEATLAKTGAHRDTLLAMPLYRIAQRWEMLKDISITAFRHKALFDTTAVRSNHFVGRSKEMEELEKLVFATDPQTVVVTALHGMGGVGKTALVTEFVYRLSHRFPGGILWADFSSNHGDPLPILASWAQLCGATELIQLPSKDIRAQAVRRVIKEHVMRNGKMLAVFDDVRNTKEDAWLEGAHLLRRSVPDEVPLLVTTRQMSVADSLHTRYKMTIEPLAIDDAINLIKQLVPTITTQIAKELADLTGSLPLAIEIVANKAISSNTQWLLDALYNPETLLDVLDTESTIRKEDSVRLSFALSFQSLSSDSASLFQTLAIFAEGYIAQEWIIDLLKHVEALPWGQQSYLVIKYLNDLTFDKRLLQLTRTGYRFHPLLRNYAHLLLRTSKMYEITAVAHMQYFLHMVTHPHRSLTDLDTALENVKLACDYAYSNCYWNEVIQYSQFLAFVGKFLHVRGHWQIAIDFLYKGIRACEQTGQNVLKASFLCQIGVHQRELGDYTLAEVTFAEATTLAEQLHDSQVSANIYFNAGYLHLYQSHFDIAATYLQKAIDFAVQCDDNNALGESLRGIGRIALSQGDIDHAESYLQRSKDILAKEQNKQGLVYSLRSLGEVYAIRKAYVDSLDCLYQSLRLAEETGDKQAMAYVQRGLGDTYLWKGDEQQALEAYKQSENLYRDVGDRAALSGALCSIGEVYNDLSNFSRAQQYFEEGYTLAQNIHVTRWQGRNLWGLARVQEKIGNRDKAIELGIQALHILEDAGHRDMRLVHTWLDSITNTPT